MDQEYVLVTGATSGIGAALAEALTRDGIPVVACGRNQDILNRFMKIGGGITLGYEFDLRETGHLEEHFTNYLRVHSCRIRGFVHCAGVYPIAPLRMMSDDDMHAVMDVNLFSAVTFLRVLTKND